MACNIPALPYCVICSGYCCLSGVGYLCCQYPQGEKLFFLKEEFFFKIILACCHVPVHSFCVVAQTVSHLDCNTFAVLIGVWSLFIHSVWLARYLLYLIVSSSVLVTVTFLELVTSAVNILKVRNYFLKIRIFCYYCGMLSCACSFILCDR